MRPTQKQNRPRGRGGRKPSGGGGGGGININRVYESNGPEGKVRGTPQQIVEKYQSLARDAQTSGDRVVAENFLQHAEHYQRILLEAMGSRPEARNHPSEQDQPDLDISDGDDGDDEDETASAADPRPQRDGNGHQRREPRPHHQPQPQPQPQPRAEVSGLTTIDATEPVGENLLVDAEELGASQPRRRRRGPPRPEQAADAPAAETAPEVSSE